MQYSMTFSSVVISVHNDVYIYLELLWEADLVL